MSSSAFEFGDNYGQGMLLGSFPVPMNNELRTGAEKENPTVSNEAKPLRWSQMLTSQNTAGFNPANYLTAYSAKFFPRARGVMVDPSSHFVQTLSSWILTGELRYINTQMSLYKRQIRRVPSKSKVPTKHSKK